MTARIQPKPDRATPSRRAARVAGEGITVGLIGAGVAMLVFLLMDVAEGMPLRTPALLGAALFHGARGAGRGHPAGRACASGEPTIRTGEDRG